MREEIGDSISTQMSRGQIFPSSGPWGLGCPWDATGGGSLPNKTREGESEREKKRKALRKRETRGKRERERVREREMGGRGQTKSDEDGMSTLKLAKESKADR